MQINSNGKIALVLLLELIFGLFLGDVGPEKQLFTWILVSSKDCNMQNDLGWETSSRAQSSLRIQSQTFVILSLGTINEPFTTIQSHGEPACRGLGNREMEGEAMWMGEWGWREKIVHEGKGRKGAGNVDGKMWTREVGLEKGRANGDEIKGGKQLYYFLTRFFCLTESN